MTIIRYELTANPSIIINWDDVKLVVTGAVGNPPSPFNLADYTSLGPEITVPVSSAPEYIRLAQYQALLEGGFTNVDALFMSQYVSNPTACPQSGASLSSAGNYDTLTDIRNVWAFTFTVDFAFGVIDIDVEYWDGAAWVHETDITSTAPYTLTQQRYRFTNDGNNITYSICQP